MLQNKMSKIDRNISSNKPNIFIQSPSPSFLTKQILSTHCETAAGDVKTVRAD